MRVDKSNETLPMAFAVLNEIGIINQLSSTRFEALLPGGLTQPQFSVLNNLKTAKQKYTVVRFGFSMKLSTHCGKNQRIPGSFGHVVGLTMVDLNPPNQ